MIRIVLDTNVIVSALAFGGLPRTVLELAAAGHCRFFYSEPIQDEVRRVLAEKMHWTPAMLQKALPVLWGTGKLVIPRITVAAVAKDPDDDRIVECALAASAGFIVSGDRDLLDLRQYKSIAILSPRAFLEEYFQE